MRATIFVAPLYSPHPHSELLSVPDDLRGVLEQCLAEDPNKENLELYLPTVRQIITNLLQGLRGKQSIYRRIVSDHKRGSEAPGHERTESRSSRSSRREHSHRSQLSRTITEDDEMRRSMPSSSRRRDVSGSESVNGNAFIGGFSPQVTSPPLPQESSSELPNPFDRHRRHVSVPQSLEPPADVAETSNRASSPASSTPTPQPSQPPQPSVPASVKRYSLVDKPVMSPPTTPSVIVEPSSPTTATPEQSTISETPTPSPTPPPPPTPDSPPIDAVQVPAIANSLAALKKSDTLERRASKRFSTYNISKMTGGSSTRERSIRGGQSNRRSMAVSSALTAGELAVLTEVDDEESPVPSPSSREGRTPISRSVTPDRPPVPPLPKTPTPEPPERRSVAAEPITEEPESSSITVFLQLGREVKKATIEPGLTFSSLRVLFVDRFSYNPGLDNFPAIYIRDPSSGVQYELEDMDEVKEKCLLSLNIERTSLSLPHFVSILIFSSALDQIKQHIDTQISSLSQDIKELRTTVVNNNRHSFMGSPIIAHPLAESTPAPNRPTDKQFHTVARRLSRFVGHANGPSSPTPPMPILPQMTGQSLQPQMTGSSVYSEYSSRVVSDLKTQFDEVQNLRRDLGIMRQLYTEFMKQTKESLGALRTQTQSVKQLANVNVGGARAFIESGKKNMDSRSQNILTDVEKLQDTVESIKADVLKRHVTPKTQYMKSIRKDIDAAASELESLREHIMTVKPMWKKTWQEELQNIVEEQQFLNHQEEFLNDLLEDHKALTNVFGHVEKVIEIRGTGSGRVPRNRSFKPPPPEQGHNGLSTVMLEIRGAQVDPEKRMKAIEESQKIRQKQLETRSDDLQAELTDFVGQKKLKMTGGAEETERVRQKRNDMTLKAMFTGGSASGDASPLGSPTPL